MLRGGYPRLREGCWLSKLYARVRTEVIRMFAFSGYFQELVKKKRNWHFMKSNIFPLYALTAESFPPFPEFLCCWFVFGFFYILFATLQPWYFRMTSILPSCDTDSPPDGGRLHLRNPPAGRRLPRNLYWSPSRTWKVSLKLFSWQETSKCSDVELQLQSLYNREFLVNVHWHRKSLIWFFRNMTPRWNTFLGFKSGLMISLIGKYIFLILLLKWVQRLCLIKPFCSMYAYINGQTLC